MSLDGAQLLWDGQLYLTNATDTTTGVLTLVLTPDGGVGALPALLAGDPGLPPVIDSVTCTSVAPGGTLPPPVLTLVSPGGPGVASHYTLALSVFQGATGNTGPSTNILSAPDVIGTATNGYILVFDGNTGKMTFSPQLVGGVYVPGTINATSGNAAQRTLAQVTIPAQPFAWVPVPFAQTVVTGTTATRVDLSCRIGNATTGAVCGYGFGSAGATPPAVTLIPAIPAGSSSTFGVQAAGAAMTIYLQANQMNTTVTDSWSTAPATTNFQVGVQPVH